MRIVAISDIHLGRKSSRARKVRSLQPLFEGADLAIINGDGVDFGWMPSEDAFRWQRELVDSLREVCPRVIWVRGNHDLPVEGPIFHREGDLVFTHGHALFDVPRGTRTFEEAFEAVYDVHFRRHSTHHLGGTVANFADRLAGRIVPLKIASRWHIGDPGSVDLSLLLRAAGEEVRTVVIGHLHITGILPRENRTVYITGAWTGRAPTTAFVHDGGESALLRVVPDGDRFRLGERIPSPPPILASR